MCKHFSRLCDRAICVWSSEWPNKSVISHATLFGLSDILNLVAEFDIVLQIFALGTLTLFAWYVMINKPQWCTECNKC